MKRISPKALARLQQHAANRLPGYVEAFLAATRMADDGSAEISEADFERLRKKYTPLRGLGDVVAAAPRQPGPGTVLHGLFTTLGFKQGGGCGCAEMQAKMDVWGVEGCREHQAEILDFLEAKAKAQGIPFARLASKLALEVALNRAVPFRQLTPPT